MFRLLSKYSLNICMQKLQVWFEYHHLKCTFIAFMATFFPWQKSAFSEPSQHAGITIVFCTFVKYASFQNIRSAPDERSFFIMKQEYIEKIIELLHQSNDLPLLDLILQLLQKSK